MPSLSHLPKPKQRASTFLSRPFEPPQCIPQVSVESSTTIPISSSSSSSRPRDRHSVSATPFPPDFFPLILYSNRRSRSLLIPLFAPFCYSPPFFPFFTCSSLNTRSKKIYIFPLSFVLFFRSRDGDRPLLFSRIILIFAATELLL